MDRIQQQSKNQYRRKSAEIVDYSDIYAQGYGVFFKYFRGFLYLN